VSSTVTTVGPVDIDPVGGGSSDPRRPLAELFRDLCTSPSGLAGREAARRLTVAGFAFVQERQAERAVDALAAFLPPHARVLRDGVVAPTAAIRSGP
jgi:hypothetical protein